LQIQLRSPQTGRRAVCATPRSGRGRRSGPWPPRRPCRTQWSWPAPRRPRGPPGAGVDRRDPRHQLRIVGFGGLAEKGADPTRPGDGRDVGDRVALPAEERRHTEPLFERSQNPAHLCAVATASLSLTEFYRVLPSLIRARTQGAPVFSTPECLLRGCDEGSESHLAEMDSGRKNRRDVHRVRDEHGPGPAPTHHRVVSGRRPAGNQIAAYRLGGC